MLVSDGSTLLRQGRLWSNVLIYLATLLFLMNTPANNKTVIHGEWTCFHHEKCQGMLTPNTLSPVL